MKTILALVAIVQVLFLALKLLNVDEGLTWAVALAPTWLTAGTSWVVFWFRVPFDTNFFHDFLPNRARFRRVRRLTGTDCCRR